MKYDYDQVVASLGANAKALDVQLFDEIDSTNQWLSVQRPERPTLVAASKQTAGRGRRGRTWESPAGGVYFSIGYPLAPGALVSPVLSLGVGVTIAEVVAGFGVNPVQVKWPNDIVVNGAKLAGILAEKAGNLLIVGVGVNWDEQRLLDLPNDRKAVSFTALCRDRSAPSREAVLGRLAQAVVNIVESSPSAITDWVDSTWPAYDALAGRAISIELAGGEVVSGVGSGVTVTGELRVMTAAGERHFNSGETRIRGGWEKAHD